MLLISSDGPLPIGRLQLEISSKGQVLLANEYRIPSEVQLPATVAVVSNGDATAQTEITVIGWKVTPGKDDVPLDRRDAIVVQVPAERVALLPIVLSARCTDKVTLLDGQAQTTCGEGNTCNGAGQCVSSTIDATDLATYRPSDENQGGAGAASAGAPASGGGTSSGGMSSAGTSNGEMSNGGMSSAGTSSAGKNGDTSADAGLGGNPGAAGDAGAAGDGGESGELAGRAGVGGSGVCAPGSTGANGCFQCPASTVQFLNQCSSVQCQGFDDTKRLGSHPTLPPLP